MRGCKNLSMGKIMRPAYTNARVMIAVSVRARSSSSSRSTTRKQLCPWRRGLVVCHHFPPSTVAGGFSRSVGRGRGRGARGGNKFEDVRHIGGLVDDATNAVSQGAVSALALGVEILPIGTVFRCVRSAPIDGEEDDARRVFELLRGGGIADVEGPQSVVDVPIQCADHMYTFSRFFDILI